VLIRPSKGGLILQTMFYADEARDFDQISKAEDVSLSPAEFELASGLIAELSSEDFEPENYEDEYQARVRGLLDNKINGREITAPPPGHVIDLMATLRESMKTLGAQTKEQSRRNKKRRVNSAADQDANTGRLAFYSYSWRFRRQ
jgi:DNA end-binding protein Ku